MLNSRSSRFAAKNAVWCAILIAFAYAPTATAQTCTIASTKKCDAGYYVKAVDDTACTACPAGLWRAAGDPLGAVTACDRCPANFYVDALAATACEACPAGTENAAGDPIDLGTSNSVITSCTAKENFYVAATDAAVATACPSGMTNAAGDAIDLGVGASSISSCDCPVNTYVDLVGATVCKACPAGTENAAGDPLFIPTAQNSDVTKCTVKANFYVAATDAVVATACPSGLVRSADPASWESGGTVTSSVTACTCPVNTYVGSATDTTCTACPAGTENPLTLNTGMYNGDAIVPGVALSTPTLCVCKEDHYVANANDKHCTSHVSTGTVNVKGDTIGTVQGVEGNCLKDHYVARVADQSCTACPAGMEKDAGAALGTASVCGCKKDYFVADSSAMECTACPAGSERVAGDTLGLATACTCKANFYVAAASGTGSCGCTACPTGMGRAAGAVLGTPSSCDRCAADFYVANIRDATCTACPAGTELAAGTDDRDLTDISDQIEFAGTTACTVKADFFVATATDTTATACPAGTIRDAGGSLSSPTLCDKCSENFHVASADATACTACPDGLVNPFGIQSITLPSYNTGATTFPTASITTANGCTGSALGAVTAKVLTATVAGGGTGYAENDEITIADAAGTGTNAVLKVATATTGASLANIQLPAYIAGATQFPTITLSDGANCAGVGIAADGVTVKVFSAVVGDNAGTGYKVGDELVLTAGTGTGTAATFVVATVEGVDQTAAAAIATVTVKDADPGAYTAIATAKFANQGVTGGTAGNDGFATFDITVVPSIVAVTAGTSCTAQSTAVFADGGSTLDPLTATPVNNNVIQTVAVKTGSEGAYSALLARTGVAQKSSTGLGSGATFDYTLVPSAVAITTAGYGCSRTTPPVVTLAGTALSPTTSTIVYNTDAIDLSAAGSSSPSWCSCPVDTYVKLNTDTTCTACPAGFANLAGDEIKTTTAASTPTTCGNCPLHTYVAADTDVTCTACPAGTERTVRDPIDTSGGTSVITACTVKANYYVADGADVGGTACPAGRTRAAGGSIGALTFCLETPCAVDEYVSSNACTACASGFVNAAGDWPSGPDTTCTTTLCASNERVLDNKCVRCGTVAVSVAGISTTVITTTTNAAGDDPSGADTLCDGSLCAVNQYVKVGVCTACAAGTTNDAHDDASGPDTSCTTAASPGSVPGASPGAPPGAPGGPGGPPAAPPAASGASNLDVKFTSMIVPLVLGFFALAM